MCGIAGIFGQSWEPWQLAAMITSQHHRGPDDQGSFISPDGAVGFGQNRLSIIDLSPAGHQPMWNREGTLGIVFNGEVYNYLELRTQLSEYSYTSQTDTEVILAAYERWGDGCLDRLAGMFAFLLWDVRAGRLLAARDRFGVKPLNYHVQSDGTLLIASEIKALHAAGVDAEPDAAIWATYLSRGLHDHSDRTFWSGIRQVPAGHKLVWKDGRAAITCWYDLATAAGSRIDNRDSANVEEEYLALLRDSVKLRFRADVPVGINLSGGLDSSTLLGLVHAVQGRDSSVRAYTFITGDDRYDELPWVRQMLERTAHPSILCRLDAAEVPDLAYSVQRHEDEPFGGLPTLAYARLFEVARADGTIVLLDGQGMDEQWAGYDYYAKALNGHAASIVQGSEDRPVRPDCLEPGFERLAEPFEALRPFGDPLRDLQYRDIRYTKIPRALRFNDRASMRSSTELREPFLDHRLMELAIGQPVERKIANGTRKWLLRGIAKRLLPNGVVEAPKRPLQTPQREWLRGPLRPWAAEMIHTALEQWGGSWLDKPSVEAVWRLYLDGGSDNSFYVWQWISLGMLTSLMRSRTMVPATPITELYS